MRKRIGAMALCAFPEALMPPADGRSEDPERAADCGPGGEGGHQRYAEFSDVASGSSNS
jgi:hypothetical protein